MNLRWTLLLETSEEFQPHPESEATHRCNPLVICLNR